MESLQRSKLRKIFATHACAFSSLGNLGLGAMSRCIEFGFLNGDAAHFVPDIRLCFDSSVGSETSSDGPHFLKGCYMRYLLASMIAFSLSSYCLGADIAIFNTGVDASSTALPGGTLGDPHYQLISVPGGTSTIRTWTVAGGGAIAGWIGDNTTSTWIGPNSGNTLIGIPGDYAFRTQFTLPSAGSVSLIGRWATDNSGLDILLNGVSSGNVNTTQFLGWTAFELSSSSVIAGTNNLDFVVRNEVGSPVNSPIGLRVEFTSATFNAVPEPSSIVLAGCGLVGLLVFAQRARSCSQKRVSFKNVDA